jgi:hypothetical protein
MVCRIGLALAYLDESASVCDGGLLAHLLHDFGLCVHFEGYLGGVGFQVRVRSGGLRVL